MRREARQLREVVDSVHEFVGAGAGFEGAEVPSARQPHVELDAGKFMRALEAALGPLPTDGGGAAGRGPMRDDGESDADSDDSDGGSGESDDDDDGAEGAAGVDGELASLMAQMDAELQQSQKADDFEMRAAPPKPAAAAAAADAAGASDGGGGAERAVDLDFNLVKQLLDSYDSQKGLPGPASNLLGSMGLALPDAADAKPPPVPPPMRESDEPVCRFR